MAYFSICIPTYNRGYIIERTLESLEKQSYDDFEIIIVDDGSTDNTEEVVGKYAQSSRREIHYFKKVNGGKHTALNVGINEAKSKFFIILDSDDILAEDALQNMYELWEKSNIDKDAFCGIMGKCADFEGNIIGRRFPYENFISSYIDFHFGSGFTLRGNKYGDCCESIRTDILKRFQYPENKFTRFVPEAYVMDKIGLQYNLLCTNTVYEYKEYMADGMTQNSQSHKEKNIVGYIIKYVSTIEDVIPNAKIPMILQIISWWKYWIAIVKDPNGNAPRCKKITFAGYIAKAAVPLLNVAYLINKKLK